MKSIPLAAAVLALSAAGPAFAANSTPATTPAANSQMQTMNAGNLREHLQDQLTKAGYTSIKIMPSSFYVQAKDKKGDPVAMVIGPDSFTEVTEVKTQNTANAQETPKSQTQNSTTQK
jgi:hypothetical protein